MLADWLNQVDTLDVGAEFTFTEPEVRFERASTLVDERIELRIFFDYEPAPPWVDADSGTEFCVSVAIGPGDRARSAAALRSEIQAATK
jgi:hypothetical protein